MTDRVGTRPGNLDACSRVCGVTPNWVSFLDQVPWAFSSHTCPRVVRGMKRAPRLRQTPAVPLGRARDHPPPAYGTEAFLVTRARFHLLYRLMARIWQFASPDGGARTGGWQVALVGFVILDLVLWATLRRPERFGFKTRLAIDSFDIALWSLAPYPGGSDYMPAIWIGIPLAVDTSLRRGAWGLLIPGVTLTVTTIVRLAAGRPVLPLLFMGLMIGVGAGMLLARYFDRLQASDEDEWVQRHSADERRDFLAGQNAVAMGADSVIDILEGLLPTIGRPKPGTVLWEFAAAWKAKLAAATADHAAYLGQVVLEWAADHNRHPDLSGRVEAYQSEGVGTTILTAAQAIELRQLLDSAALQGQVAVGLENPIPTDQPPGGALRLVVNSQVMEVRGDPSRPPQPYDPGPATFIISAFLMLLDLTDYGVGVGIPAGLTGVSFSLLAAWWAHMRLRQFGMRARKSVMTAAVAVAVTYTAIATLGLRPNPSAAGFGQYAVVPGLDLLGLLGAMYWRYLKTPTRVLVLAGATVVVAIGVLPQSPDTNPFRLMLVAAWALPLLASGLSLADELVAAAQAYRQGLTAHTATAQSAAFRRGQLAVLDLVRQASQEAHERLDSLGDSLPSEVAGHARQQLGEVDRRLGKLLRLDESLS